MAPLVKDDQAVIGMVITDTVTLPTMLDSPTE